jgi:hypothetical protein
VGHRQSWRFGDYVGGPDEFWVAVVRVGRVVQLLEVPTLLTGRPAFTDTELDAIVDRLVQRTQRALGAA